MQILPCMNHEDWCSIQDEMTVFQPATVRDKECARVFVMKVSRQAKPSATEWGPRKADPHPRPGPTRVAGCGLSGAIRDVDYWAMNRTRTHRLSTVRTF
jgi:hypothetical protein